MKQICLTSFFCFTCLVSICQNVAKKDSSRWKKERSLTIMGAQTGTRNWMPANEKFSITGVGLLHLSATQLKGRNQWDNTADLHYGIANTESGGVRKVEDKLDIFSRYGNYFSKQIGYGVVAGLRTQFSNSFDHSETPRKRVSGFFAPAYIVLSPGVHFKPSHDLIVTAGPAVRWIFVSNAPYSYTYQGGIKPGGEREKSIAEIYGVHPDKESRTEKGMLITASYTKMNIVKNIDYRGRLEAMADLFPQDVVNQYGSLLRERDIQSDLYWANSFTLNVNKWIRVNYSFDIVYDPDVMIFGEERNETAIQMRSLLGVGLVASF